MILVRTRKHSVAFILTVTLAAGNALGLSAASTERSFTTGTEPETSARVTSISVGSPRATPVLEVIGAKGVPIDATLRSRPKRPAAPPSGREQQQGTLSKNKKNWVSTKIIERHRAKGTLDLFERIQRSSGRQELHDLIGQLPVDRRVEAAQDGRNGSYTYFSVSGVDRVRLFRPASGASKKPAAVQADLVSAYGTEVPDGASSIPVKTGSREDVCYWEEVEGDCPTEQELDDAAALIASMEAEEAQAEADLADLDAEYALYCSQYFCESPSNSEVGHMASEGETDAEPGFAAEWETNWGCVLVASCAWQAADAAAGVVGHAVSRIALAMTFNSHMAGIAATGVGVSVFGWGVAIAGAALGTYGLVRGIISYAQCQQGLPI